MNFKTYKKIHRLGTEENEGILMGTCYIQEKIDGANASIWLAEDGIHCGSRNQDVTGGSFNGFVEYVKAHPGVNKLLEDHPTYRLWGEWLVKHTVTYNEQAYRHFYLFDIEDGESLLDLEQVYTLAEEYSISTPQLFGKFEFPTQDQVKEFVGKTCLGEKGEGVVIKNFKFINKFGEYNHAKVVTDNFKEDHAVAMGGNDRHAEFYHEIYVMNKYMTLPRIQKIMSKIQPLIEKRLDERETARIINTAYHDMLTEEIWEIQKDVPSVNFKKLQSLCTRKAAQTYLELIKESPTPLPL